MVQKGLAFDNAFNFVGEDDYMEMFFEGHYFSDIFIIQLVVTVGMFQLFLISRLTFRTLCKSFFNALVFHDKMKLIYSGVNVSVLLGFLVPYTIECCNGIYGPNFVEYFHNNYRKVFAYVTMHEVLYVVEMGSELTINVRKGKLLVIHHCVWFVMIILAAWFRSVFQMKLCLVLDMFVNYEFGLFLALLVRRLSDNIRLRKCGIVFGSMVFIVSRFIQAAMLIHFVSGSADRMLSGTAEQQVLFVAGVVMSTFLLGLQLYTKLIYYKLYQKEVQNERVQNESMPVDIEIPDEDVVAQVMSARISECMGWKMTVGSRMSNKMSGAMNDQMGKKFSDRMHATRTDQSDACRLPF